MNIPCPGRDDKYIASLCFAFTCFVVMFLSVLINIGDLLVTLLLKENHLDNPDIIKDVKPKTCTTTEANKISQLYRK